jgi:hypothetical protein
MEKWLERIHKVVLLLLTISVVGIVNLLAHEFGHCLCINALGGECEGVYAWPGVRLWPLSIFGQPFEGDWNNIMGAARYAQRPDETWKNGLVSLMSSGIVVSTSPPFKAAGEFIMTCFWGFPISRAVVEFPGRRHSPLQDGSRHKFGHRDVPQWT